MEMSLRPYPDLRPITQHNRRQRLVALSQKLSDFARDVHVWGGGHCMLNPDKRKVTVAIRCIQQLARDLYRTNSRPIINKRKK